MTPQEVSVKLDRGEAITLADVGAAWLRPDESGDAPSSPPLNRALAKLRAALQEEAQPSPDRDKKLEQAEADARFWRDEYNDAIAKQAPGDSMYCVSFSGGPLADVGGFWPNREEPMRLRDGDYRFSEYGSDHDLVFEWHAKEAQPSEGEGEKLIQKFAARAEELYAMQREWEAKPGGSEPGRLNYTYATRCAAIYEFIRDELLGILEAAQPDPQSSVEQGVVEVEKLLSDEAVEAAARSTWEVNGRLKGQDDWAADYPPDRSTWMDEARRDLEAALAATKGTN